MHYSVLRIGGFVSCALLGIGCLSADGDHEATMSPASLPVAAGLPTGEPPTRRVAVTFDDLPQTGPLGGPCHADSVLALNRRLLKEIEAHGVPATGFVNEGNCRGGGILEQVLRQWLEAGHTLGNHTFSHTNLDAVSLDAYLDDIERGEPLTRALLTERGETLRYFRHPQLHAGADSAKWHGLRAYLDANGYIVAPVTIDNQEWVFEAVYSRAKRRGDGAMMERVVEAYVPHLSAVVEHFEGWSEEVVGYEPPQILLLHANEINADHFSRVAAMLRERGYAFVSLEEALADPAYNLADGYIGPRGLSWVHRWALGKGFEKIKEEPREPEWIAELFQSYR